MKFKKIFFLILLNASLHAQNNIFINNIQVPREIAYLSEYCKAALENFCTKESKENKITIIDMTPIEAQMIFNNFLYRIYNFYRTNNINLHDSREELSKRFFSENFLNIFRALNFSNIKSTSQNMFIAHLQKLKRLVILADYLFIPELKDCATHFLVNKLLSPQSLELFKEGNKEFLTILQDTYSKFNLHQAVNPFIRQTFLYLYTINNVLNYSNPIAFIPNNKYVATINNFVTKTRDQLESIPIQLRNIENGQLYFDIPNRSMIKKIIFSPDGKYISIRSDAILIDNPNLSIYKIYNIKNKQIQMWVSHPDFINSIEFSPNSKYIATASWDSHAAVWNIATNREDFINQMPGPIFSIIHAAEVNQAVFSPDSRYVATASNDNTAQVWNIAEEQILLTINHNRPVSSVLFSPDSRYVATTSDDHTTQVWDIEKRTRILTINHNQNAISMCFSPDSKLIATTSLDHITQLWNLEERERILNINNYSLELKQAFSPDSKLIATVSNNNEAQIWDIRQRQIYFTINHNNSIKSIEFSPYGKYIATTTNNNTAQLWDIKTSTKILTIKHNNRVNSVVFSLNNKYVGTASSDCTAQIWTEINVKNLEEVLFIKLLESLGKQNQLSYIRSKKHLKEIFLRFDPASRNKIKNKYKF